MIAVAVIFLVAFVVIWAGLILAPNHEIPPSYFSTLSFSALFISGLVLAIHTLA